MGISKSEGINAQYYESVADITDEEVIVADYKYNLREVIEKANN